VAIQTHHGRLCCFNHQPKPGDLAFDAWAYSFALASVVTQACYLLLVEFQVSTDGGFVCSLTVASWLRWTPTTNPLCSAAPHNKQGDAGATSTSELLWFNALTALPLLLALTVANGDFGRVSAAYAKGVAAHSSAYVMTMVIGAATLGCLLNYSMFLSTLHNSALTTTIVGVLRGVATVLLGFALDTVPFSRLNILGITLNTAGGVWYTYIKYTEKAASKRTKGPGGGVSGGAYAKLASADGSEHGHDAAPGDAGANGSDSKSYV
jgi:solute carrier family 35 protein